MPERNSTASLLDEIAAGLNQLGETHAPDQRSVLHFVRRAGEAAEQST